MYRINVWLHILMATIWVGGLIYTMAVVIPFALSLSKEERQPILRGLARRFRKIGWAGIVVLIVTGLVNLYIRSEDPMGYWAIVGEPGNNQFTSNTEFSTLSYRFGRWMIIKLILVIVMIALMLFHDITSLRDAKRHEGKAGSPPHNRAGSIAAALATLLTIIILYISVRLVRG